MAKVRNGKVQGRIGNTVHRVLRGQEIIQSYPRTLAPKGEALIENSLFGECSSMNAKIYKLIKEFALRFLDYSFSWEMMALLKRSFFQRKDLQRPNRFEEWEKIEEATNLAINKHVILTDVLFKLPEVNLVDDKLIIQFPEHETINSSLLMKDIEAMEYSFMIVHYNSKLQVAEVIQSVNSERRHLSEGFPAKTIEVNLSEEDIDINEGLILVCCGLRFFASTISYGYLNSMEINPTAILGMWYKKSDL